MKKLEQFREQFVPWAGLVVGLMGTGLVHQIGSEGTFNDCATVSPLPILILCLLGIVVTTAAALVSWRVARETSQGPSRRLVGLISVGAAALFVFAMLLPMLAALMLPPCFE